LVVYLSQVAGALAVESGEAIDFDIREALEALIKTYRTLQSGVYYESIPANPLAASIFAGVQRAVASLREQQQKDAGMTRTRDADVLGVLVFLQRLEFSRNNGRKRGRAFIHFLNLAYLTSQPPSPESSPLILP